LDLRAQPTSVLCVLLGPCYRVADPFGSRGQIKADTWASIAPQYDSRYTVYTLSNKKNLTFPVMRSEFFRIGFGFGVWFFRGRAWIGDVYL
jgi:hypothetical protein